MATNYLKKIIDIQLNILTLGYKLEVYILL